VQFLLLISHDDSFMPTDSLVADICSWHEEMARHGLLRDGRPLRPPSEAVTVRVRNGEREVAAGPATDGSNQTAAYDLVECESLQEAVEAAAAHPMAAAGAVEVRPVWAELAGTDRPVDATDPRFEAPGE
jgi:hypothetical protein